MALGLMSLESECNDNNNNNYISECSSCGLLIVNKI